MGLVESYAEQLHTEYSIRAVWPPVVTTIRIGDYGLLRGGVFEKLGNIADDYALAPLVEPAGSIAAMRLRSGGVTALRFEAGVRVPAFHSGMVNAELQLHLTRDNDFLLDAPQVTATSLKNTALIGHALGLVSAWRRRWKIVSAVYAASDAVVLGSSQRGKVVTLKGAGSELLRFDTGAVHAGLTLEGASDLAFDVRGSGPIGVKLVQRTFLGQMVPRSTGDPEPNYFEEPSDDDY